MRRLTRVYLFVSVLVFLTAGIFLLSYKPQSKASTMANAWYSCNPCEEMTLRQYAMLTDSLPQKSVVVSDAAVIASVVALLDTLPTTGDKYKSFSEETELLQIELSGGGKTSVVEFYDGRLKTPETTIMDHSNPEQIQLYKLALALLK